MTTNVGYVYLNDVAGPYFRIWLDLFRTKAIYPPRNKYQMAPIEKSILAWRTWLISDTPGKGNVFACEGKVVEQTHEVHAHT